MMLGRGIKRGNTLGGATVTRKLLITFCLGLVFALVGATSAQAEFGLKPGSFAVEVSDPQASGHPDIVTKFAFRTRIRICRKVS